MLRIHFERKSHCTIINTPISLKYIGWRKVGKEDYQNKRFQCKHGWKLLLQSMATRLHPLLDTYFIPTQKFSFAELPFAHYHGLMNCE